MKEQRGGRTLSKLPKVTTAERLQWSHDRMMVALRRAAACRSDVSLTTAAFARVEEYDKALLSRQHAFAKARAGAIARARRASDCARFLRLYPQAAEAT